jgi:hypothetical protein
MTIDTIKSAAMRSKCAALVSETKSRVSQIDRTLFPTPASDTALKLLSQTLDFLSDAELMEPADPEVFYNRLIKLQSLVDDLENSSSRQIPWPIVHYCNDIWGELFKDGENAALEVFYSLTHDHNYYITSFSTRLARVLRYILPQAAIDNIIGENGLYCLHLPSIEQNNLPLYANIAHEYGHALYDYHSEVITTRWVSAFSEALAAVFNHLRQVDASQASRRRKRVIYIFNSLAQEVFADRVAAALAGPAFFLSLYEMAWGSNPCTWSVTLYPVDKDIHAYPSPSFRLSLLKEDPDFITFERDARKDFGDCKSKILREIVTSIKDIPTEHSADIVNVYPIADSDSHAIADALTKELSKIKKAVQTFGADALSLVAMDSVLVSALETRRISTLLRRFESNVLPNIVPDNTLLGQPASFPEILNAAALFRLSALIGAKPKDEDIAQHLRKIERLTLKALEVSYVQRRFNLRVKG